MDLLKNSVTILLLLLTPLFIYNQGTNAQQLVCPQRAIEQYTFAPSGNSRAPDLTADGGLMTFFSSANLNGTNPDTNAEIWLVDTVTGIITQITDEPSGTSDFPTISANGDRIAFESSANINGTNPDTNTEIWVFDGGTGTFIQITDTLGVNISSRRPSISGNSLFVSFESDANINGGNPDMNDEIWLANINTGTITQITNTIGDDGGSQPATNADGTLTAFEHDGNINGLNPDGSNEIWLFNSTTGTTTQITNTPADTSSREPSIGDDGALITFSSNGNLGGLNPDGSREIWIFDTTTGQFTNTTNLPGGLFADEPDISGNGLFVAFRSRANINGGNPSGESQIWVYDSTTGLITQITREPDGFSEEATINENGMFIGFDSPANINGGNPDLSPDQIYLAKCLNPMDARAIPTLSEWGLIAMAGILGLVGFIAVRRKYVVS